MSNETNIVRQGAEAKIYKTVLFGKNVMIKERFSKKYRHENLDNRLTSKRTLQEARMILKCRKAGIKTPVIYLVDTKLNRIYMEEVVDGKTLREDIDILLKQNKENELKDMAFQIGSIISRLHQNDIIHGDLTTSNVLVEKKDDETSCNKIYTFIDFGLSFTSSFIEDMGVDLYVLERAFLSTHPKTEWLFELILASYKKNFEDEKRANEIIEKLNEVRMRGRKRVMIG